MTHEDFQDLLAVRALSALDPAEALALEAHLETCAACRQESGEWGNIVSSLTFAASPLEPPGQLRERILAQVRADRETSDHLAHERSDSAARNAPRRGWEPISKATGDLSAARAGMVWSSFRTVGALAASLLFIAFIIGLFALWQQNRSRQTELARLSDELQRTTSQLNHQRSVVQLLTSPGAHMSRLAGTKAAPAAQGMLAYDQNGHAMLMTRGLPAAPSGMAYQLWFIKDNQKLPGKMFVPDIAGNGMLEDQLPDVARGGASFAVTLEPATGVAVPTGSIYLLSSTGAV
jgi:anti-sigma factor RsiW